MKRILLALVIGGLFALAGISLGELLIIVIAGLIWGMVTWLEHATRHYERDSIARDGHQERLADTIPFDSYAEHSYETDTHAPLEPVFEDEPDTSPPLEVDNNDFIEFEEEPDYPFPPLPDYNGEDLPESQLSEEYLEAAVKRVRPRIRLALNKAQWYNDLNSPEESEE